MDSKLVEQLDSRRYKYLLFQTIGFALLMPGVYLDSQTFEHRALRIVFAVLVAIGALAFVAGTLLNSSNERRIKGDPELRKVLNNEMVVHYGYKSLKSACLVAIMVAVPLCLVSSWWLTDMTATTACLLIIYAAVLGLNISRLIYMRK